MFVCVCVCIHVCVCMCVHSCVVCILQMAVCFIEEGSSVCICAYICVCLCARVYALIGLLHHCHICQVAIQRTLAHRTEAQGIASVCVCVCVFVCVCMRVTCVSRVCVQGV
jgi:hypothetical protein